jgi:hypothetical protein
MSSENTSHHSVGEVTEMNVALDGGDGGYARVVLVDDSGNTTSALIPKTIAYEAALDLSPHVVDERLIDAQGSQTESKTTSSDT